MRRLPSRELFTTWCAVGLLVACAPKPEAGVWGGWAEGEAVTIAAPVAGRVASAVDEGTTVAAGAPLFALDGALERDAAAEAAARARSAERTASDAASGKRADELAVVAAQARSARAQAALAQSDLARKQDLAAKGFVARAQVDDAANRLRAAEAAVAEADALLRAAQLPGRPDQRAAAEALADAARQQQAQAAWRLGETTQRAPQAGLVQTLYRRPGEWVTAGQPVMALLPPAQRVAVFYVPERERGAVAPGARVQITCDGCGAPMAARITRIAAQAEYTPPVIYSNAQRAALVFRAEARPEQAADALRLAPGQPLDVRAVQAARAEQGAHD